jgi:hypothetical protein
MNKSDLNNLSTSDVEDLLDLVRDAKKPNPHLWFKLSDMISTDVEETEYVIVWQDMEFNYHQVTGSRVFTDFDAAEKATKGLFGAYRCEPMRKRDFDYLNNQINNDNDE